MDQPLLSALMWNEVVREMYCTTAYMSLVLNTNVCLNEYQLSINLRQALYHSQTLNHDQMVV